MSTSARRTPARPLHVLAVNTVIPTSEVFFPVHEKPQHQPQGPPCNDYRCPPHLTIGDVL